MTEKKHTRFWLSLTLFSLTGQIAWVVENMYFNVFIYNMFRASASDIAAMVAASAVTATLTTVLIGALSDKLGRRRLFIAGGYILWGISIFAFVFLRMELLSPLASSLTAAASLGVTLAIFLDCIMTFFGSSANDAAFNAWLTDSAEGKRRGLAEGINAMMPLVSILVVFGGFMFFDLARPESWTVIFSVIGGVVIGIGILGFFIIEEPPLSPAEGSYFGGIAYGFRPATVRENGLLYLALAAFVLFNISIQVFMPYLILYYEVSLGMSDYVLIMAPAILLAAVATVFFGKLYDARGFASSGALSLLLLFAGYAILALARTTFPVFLGSLFMMTGYLAGMAVFGALIRDRTPAGKAGRLQGVRIFSQVLLPGVIGPFIGQAVLANAEEILNSDGTYSFVPNANIFPAAAGVLLLSLPLFFLLARRTRRP